MGFLSKFRNLIVRKETGTESMKKFLIVGLGNIGDTYKNTRHNIGFSVLDSLAAKSGVQFETKKLGDLAQYQVKGRTFLLLKPSTYMNLSGKAVKYWLEKEKLLPENLFVLTDDLNLPFGTIRIKGNGSSGGHNGLQNIQDVLQTQNYARLRFGVGEPIKKGQQVDHVLGEWSEDENKILPERLEKMAEAVTFFGMAGLQNTMNAFNGK
jgi:PTH1 family peptidyl-tRNA hydrolase